MSFVDVQELLSDAQALTASGASTNHKDHLAARKIGKGEPLVVVIEVKVAAKVSATDETYKFALEFDDNDSFTSPRAVVERAYTNAQAAASLGLGARVVLPIPADAESGERYFRVYYTLGGTGPTITVSARITLASMLQNEEYFADNRTIS